MVGSNKARIAVTGHTIKLIITIFSINEKKNSLTCRFFPVDWNYNIIRSILLFSHFKYSKLKNSKGEKGQTE